MDLLAGDVELTEFEAIDVQTIKGVREGANGFPILMMKGLAPAAEGGADLPGAPAAAAEPEFGREAAKALAKAVLADLAASPGELFKAVGKRGQVDEAPDIDLGNQIIALLGQAIAAEAQEVAAGNAGEVCDIQELACALQAVRCWRDGEQAVSLGDIMPASMLMQSAGGDVEKGPSAEERRKAASEGNALPDGSYPITNAHELHSAAILARSGHGDVAAAKRLIARRAKELGVANPLDDSDDTSKSAIAPEETTVDTVTQEAGGLTKAVEDAIAKATQPLQERIKTLDAELAKVKAAPVPSPLVLSRNVQVKQPGAVANEDWAAKAAYYRDMAETVTDRVSADGYRKLARDADAKAVIPAS